MINSINISKYLTQSVQKQLHKNAVIAISGLIAASFVYQTVELAATATATSSGSQVSSINSNKSDVDYSEVIAKSNLFGNTSGAGPVVEKDNLPKTNLKLTLRAVFASTNNQNASAIIEDSSKNTQMYHIDSTLPGNATLHSVYKDRVVLKRGGKLENLHFPVTNSPVIKNYEPSADNAETKVSNNEKDTKKIASNNIPEQKQQRLKERLLELKEKSK